MKSTADWKWSIQPAGDRCVMIEFGLQIDLKINQMVHAVAAYLQAHPIIGVVDVVPSFTTLALHYRPEVLAGVALTPYQLIRQQIENMLSQGIVANHTATRTIDIPVCYGGEYGPDLLDVAETCKLTPDQVIQLHSNSLSFVFMLGFAPGNPYAGMLDPRIKVPRRATPRTKVAAGTVAIANGQTVIYPMQLPGGWNLIGRTPLKLFDPASTSAPCLLNPGDQLRFVPITAAQFEAMQGQKS